MSTDCFSFFGALSRTSVFELNVKIGVWSTKEHIVVLGSPRF